MRVEMRSHDHPPPHVHVHCAGEAALVEILPPRRLLGRLHPRARRLLSKWLKLHEEALLANWTRAQAGLPLRAIAPLP
jgi:hypothetical protein